MKLSTRLKRDVDPSLLFGVGKYANPNGDCTVVPVVLMVDCERQYKNDGIFQSYSLGMLDEYHRYLTKDEHCTLLPNESPVWNGKEIIMHYTSTNYLNWCRR